jgi:hypothetical protein
MTQNALAPEMSRTTCMNTVGLPAKGRASNPCRAASEALAVLELPVFRFVSIYRLYSKRRVCTLRSDCA